MSVAYPVRERTGLPERLAWIGLGCSLLAIASWASMDRPRVLLYSAFGPEDLKTWAAAIAAAAGSISTAVSVLIIAGQKVAQFVRWLRDPGRRRAPGKKRDKPDATPKPPDPAPAPAAA